MNFQDKNATPRWKSAVALAILCTYILLTIFKSARATAPATMLPANVRDFLIFTTVELLFFGVFWLASWRISRAGADELMLLWKNGWAPVWQGLLYSIALRLAPVIVLIWLFTIAVMCGLKAESIQHFVTRYGPATDRVVSGTAMSDPLYRLILLTWGSFIVAGLREELWRASMLALSTRLLQPALPNHKAAACALVFSSILFGFAHLYQGWLAVGATAFIGLILGAITLKHRSIWPAVIAHGAFDATTFWMLYQLPGIGKH